MKQLKITDWPEKLNDQAGMLRMEPAEIESRINLRFEQSQDSLDRFVGCLVKLDKNQVFALMRYANNPTLGTLIVMLEGSYNPAAGPEQFQEILDALGVSQNDLVWRRTN